MFREYPDILTVAQVAKALGVCKKSVYALVNEKKLGHLRIGRTIKVPKEQLVGYVKTAQNNVEL